MINKRTLCWGLALVLLFQLAGCGTVRDGGQTAPMTDPTDPTKTTSPGTDADMPEDKEPTDPIGPEVPTPSGEPDASSESDTSEKPGEPEQPDEPEKPDASEKPEEPDVPPAEPDDGRDPTNDPKPDIDTLLASMTLREKVGQLFIVRPNDIYEIAAGRDGSSAIVTSLSDAMRGVMAKYPVGGFAMFWQNISGPEQITSFIADLQSASSIPLFIAVDEEGGLVARLANNSAFDLPKYESPAAVAKDGDASRALAMGQTIGAYLKKYGFNLDFAPVADVNTNPQNPVIGTRSFSSDPHIAAEMVSAMAAGLRKEGITPTFKHFPGHGDTSEDSHTGVALSGKTREEMETCEWLPFKEAGDTDAIMVGHITTPNLTHDGLPATLSRELVTDILRGDLGFQGLVITDALEMGAIINEYGCGTAAVMSFKAGCDILLMPEDLEEAFEAILSSVESGEISMERLDESVRRILTFKALRSDLF